MTDLRLGKNDRLKKRKVIQHVFSSGASVKGYPVVIIFAIAEKDGPEAIRAGFSVPKRKVKSAAKRNLVKRRIKEAYRLNRNLLDLSTLADDKQIVVMCIYMTSEILAFKDIQKGVIKALKRLSDKIAQS